MRLSTPAKLPSARRAPGGVVTQYVIHTQGVSIKRRPRWFAAALLLSCSLSLGGCSGPTERYPSPNGERDVVIELGQTVIDNLWTVSVAEDALFGASQVLGCFTDDDPSSGTPTGVTWSDADTVVIETTTTDVRVGLNSDLSVGSVQQESDDFLAPCPYS